MSYKILQLFIRLGLKLFCSQISISGKDSAGRQGPCLVVANHPNSFLDAVIIGSLFQNPVYYLARGDVFNKSWQKKLLGMLNMIPVYRISEGKENLRLNNESFGQSREILSGKGILLIFIEGICIHQQHLQPFKKGAARIALQCEKDGIPLTVLPLTITYNSFTGIGKKVVVNIDQPLTLSEVFPSEEESKKIHHFNNVMQEKLDDLLSKPVNEKENRKQNRMLAVPAVIGWVLHFPLYTITKKIIRQKTKGTVFYDSVLFSVLLFLYPCYIVCIVIAMLLLHVQDVPVFLIALAHPLTAYCTVQALGDNIIK